MTGSRIPPRVRDAALAAVAAFSLGVQARLLHAAGGIGGYPPPGSEGLAYSTLLLLAGLAMVAADRLRRGLPDRSTLPQLPDPSPVLRLLRRAVAPVAEAARASLADARAPSAGGAADRSPAGRRPEPAADASESPQVEVDLETPLHEAPVIAPGEALPVRVRAEAPSTEDLEARIEVRRGQGGSSKAISLSSGAATRSLALEGTGPVEVRVTVTHPRAEAGTATVRGRVQPYREAVGDILDRLREASGAGEEATPREVCQGLPGETERGLRRALEAALYGDETVDRGAYLAIRARASQVGTEGGDP